VSGGHLRSIVVGTAGHIDHGKSALVRALTGTDPDRLKEEQARGITIDLGFAHLETGGVNLAFVDVPGHERFVKNMLAGAGGIDLVMLVVAADESVMPQTREHFEICRLLRVPAGVIALTKADVADADMQELAALEVKELVAGSFLENAPIVRVSAKDRRGLGDLETALVAAARAAPVRQGDGPPRLPIDRAFTIKGFGTVVTGTLVSGEMKQEQDLVILPRRRPVKVRGLQVHGHSTSSASAGQRVAVNLGGVEVADLSRGDTLTASDAFEDTRRLDATVDLIEGTRPLRHGARVRFHQGTVEVLGRVALAGRRTGEGTAVELPPGGSAFARVRLESPVVLTRGDRFILRAYSPPVTIGGGTVLDPRPPRGAIRTPQALARFRRLDAATVDASGALGVFLEERGAAGLPIPTLVSRAGLPASAAKAAAAPLVASGAAVAVGDLLVLSSVIERLSAALLELLTVHHRDQPLSEGVPREEARERLFGRAAPEVFEHVVQTLVTAGRITARDRLALSGHQLTLTPEESRARDALDDLLRHARLAPPDLTAIAGTIGADVDVVERVARVMVRQQTLVKLDSLLFHASALQRLKDEVRALKAAGTKTVDVAAFKERYAITRKYAIPLLEYLDRERVTRRAGDSRVIL
jgi:selenocysteine-specific elongation factor